MAAIVFPANPTYGQVFTAGTRSWVWNNTGWESTFTYDYEVNGGDMSEVQTTGGTLIDGGSA